MFCVGQRNTYCLGFFSSSYYIFFWMIWVVMKRTFKFFTALVVKRTNYKQWFYCGCCWAVADFGGGGAWAGCC